MSGEPTPDGPVMVRFVLRNDGPRTLYVLRWYTPLEGVRGKIFTVTRDGVAIPYRGPMVKRGQPQAGNYAAIAPGDSVANEVDLARAYDLSRPGKYTVKFTSHIYDYAWSESEINQQQETQRTIELSCGEIVVTIGAP